MKKTDFNPETILRNAIEDGRRRNYRAAVVKLKKVLGATDRLPEAMLYLGRAYHELKMFNEAVVSFRLFITNSPKSSAGYFYLGRTYISILKFERAASCFSESLQLKPDFSPAMAYLGYSRMRCGAFDDAVKYLGRAVELTPENSRIYMMYINSILLMSLKEFREENYESALDGLLFLEKAGYSSITTILYTGIIMKELSRYAEAADYIERASEMEPGDSLVKNILAELYIRLSRIDEAMQLLQSYKSDDEIRAFLNEVDDSESGIATAFWNKHNYRAALHYALASLRKKRTASMHLLAGECLKEAGKLDDSFNHFSRAHDIEKNSVEPFYGRAVIFWLRKDFTSMLKELARIKRLNNNDDFANYYSVLCSSRLNLTFADWKDFLLAIPDRENDPWLLTAEASGESSAGNPGKAVTLFRKSLKLDESLRESWEGLIKTLTSVKDEKGLASVLKKYLVKFSSDRKRRKNYIRILVKNEKYSAAAEQYGILAAESNPGTAILAGYAFCCRKAGNFRDAALLYRQLLAADPFNEGYLKTLLYCMRKDGRDKDTLPLLRQAVKAFKKPSLDMLLVYGTSLYRNDMVEEALNIFQKCIYDGYNDWRIYRNMSVIYNERGLKDWADMYSKKAEKSKKN